MDPIRHQPVDTNALLPGHNPPAKRPVSEVDEPQHAPSTKRLPAFAEASASTLRQFQHRHQGGDVSLHFSRFEALSDSLKQYASENLERLQAFAEKLKTATPYEQNKAIREASIEDLTLLVNLRTANVTHRDMAALEIQKREQGSTAFPIEPEPNVSKAINLDDYFDPVLERVQTVNPVDRPYAREAQELAEKLSAPHSQSEYNRALLGAKTTTLELLTEPGMATPVVRNLALLELRQRAHPDQSLYVQRHVDQFETLPAPLKAHAIENLGRIRALAERIKTALPDGQNEAIRKASIEDLKILVRLAIASPTAREMATMEIETREKGKPTAFP